jgi:hypothetical protein
VRDCKPRAYETPANKSHCPVGMYKEYRNRRPRGFYNSTDPFYLAVAVPKMKGIQIPHRLDGVFLPSNSLSNSVLISVSVNGSARWLRTPP